MGPRRRAADRVWWRRVRHRLGRILARLHIVARENWYRDVWLLIISVVVLWTGITAVDGSNWARQAARTAERAFVKQLEGRRVAIKVTCAAISGVAQAGRSEIVSSAVLVSAGQERAIEALGFPPARVRELAAGKRADAYVRALSLAVDKQIGHAGDRLVRRNGTLDCARLVALAGAG